MSLSTHFSLMGLSIVYHKKAAGDLLLLTGNLADSNRIQWVPCDLSCAIMPTTSPICKVVVKSRITNAEAACLEPATGTVSLISTEYWFKMWVKSRPLVLRLVGS